MVPQRAEGALLDRAETATPASIDDLARGDVLVLAPHADDETLGCGQAIAAAVAAGRRVRIVLVTDGAASHPNSRSHPPPVLRALRRREFDRAVAALGGGEIETVALDLADASLRLSDARAIARCIAPHAEGLEAGTLWAPWGGDPHCDHEAVAAAACHVAGASGMPHWSYAVWGRFGARDVPEAACLRRFHEPALLDAKRRAADAYRSQLTELIADDPDAFVMPPALTRHFVETPEIFIAQTAQTAQTAGPRPQAARSQRG